MFGKLFGSTKKDSSEKEQKKAPIKPHYLTGEYPAGYNGLDSSIKNALAVIKEIRTSLSNQIENAADSLPEIKENERHQFERDNYSARVVLEKIDELIVKLNVLEGKTKASLLSNPEQSFNDLDEIVAAAQDTTSALAITGTQVLNAVQALIDILQITRRAIPNLTDHLKEKKGLIQTTINQALEHETMVKRMIVIWQNESTKQAANEIKEDIKKLKQVDSTDNAETSSEIENELSQSQRTISK